MSELDPSKRRALRAQAHHLHPIVAIGSHGLTPAVLHEIDVNLLAHGLIKLRVFSDDRAERERLLRAICEALDAAPVQHVGKVLVIFREPPEEEPEPVRPPSRPKRGARTTPRAPAPAPHARGRSGPGSKHRASSAGPSAAPRQGAAVPGAGGKGAGQRRPTGGAGSGRRSGAAAALTPSARPPRARRRRG